MSEQIEKPEETEDIVIPDPDPTNKIEVYLHTLIGLLGVSIEQHNDFMAIFTKGSEPEPAKGKTVRLMDGTEMSFR